MDTKTAKTTGAALVGRALARLEVKTAFFLMGGPMFDAENACIAEGMRMIDVRHEQAAAMMAHAYARVTTRPGVCMACSGPGAINLSTGLATSLIDCVPVVAFGGSSPVDQYGMGAFQEIDQVAIMRPVTKWADRVYEAKRIPQYVELAFSKAMSGKPGPVYVDLPADVLREEIDESAVRWPRSFGERVLPRSGASPDAIERILKALEASERPLLLTGSGILWSGASEALQHFVEQTGIPFYTTPQGRGVVPEDHKFFYANARSAAYKEADLLLVVGTRLNYVFSFARPPRFSPAVKIIRIDTDADEIGSGVRLEAGIVGDAKTVLEQLTEAARKRVGTDRYAAWRSKLGAIETEKAPKQEAKISTDQLPIHPLRLCKEVRDVITRDTIVVVDGQEILNYARQAIPSFLPGHRLNSGTFGTMGTGLPYGLGAKAARPEKQVVVIHGDGSFGLNGMELDTAVRHKLPVLVVISLNGGWTGDPEQVKPGRNLGYTRFDKMAQALGCHGEFVEQPAEIRPALERAQRAVASGQTAVVNIITDWRARAETVAFARQMT